MDEPSCLWTELAAKNRLTLANLSQLITIYENIEKYRLRAIGPMFNFNGFAALVHFVPMLAGVTASKTFTH